MKAIRVHTPGGPEAMVAEEIAIPRPGPGEALVRLKAVGLNYVDIYQRSGLYKLPAPFTPGNEGAGIVEAVGEGVSEVAAGDRVAWCMHVGAYAEYAVIPAWKLVPLPETVSFEMAAAIMLQGLTAHYLALSTFPLKHGHRALIHAAAGGVGLLLTQVAKRLGATVYGTVGSAAKAELARQAGADATILYREVDFAEEIKRLTDGRGVDVVYDSVGKDTFMNSVKCLVPRGHAVSFGQASGLVPPIELHTLPNSVVVTRVSLAHHMLTREELLGRARDVFGWVAEGSLQIRIDSTFPLAEAAEAHRRLESRQSSGKMLLTL